MTAHTHDPIPIEALTMRPPETVPVIAVVGHRCAECGDACEGKEPT